MELDEMVMKLVGPVNAVGESNQDAKRLENLESLVTLVDRLLYKIEDASKDANRQEASMKAIGVRASAFLKAVRES